MSQNEGSGLKSAKESPSISRQDNQDFKQRKIQNINKHSGTGLKDPFLFKMCLGAEEAQALKFS